MAAILVVLLLSWLLLWFTERKGLRVLGWRPSKAWLRDFTAGLLIAGLAGGMYHLIKDALAHVQRSPNPGYSFLQLTKSVWWVLRSVLLEELLFRGVLLYLLIRKIGTGKACLLSALCFGIYHWFSYQLWGNPVQMVFVFLLTAVAGWIFARAFARTGSLYLPIALHFGLNAVNIIVFSHGPLGPQLLNGTPPQPVAPLPGLALYLFQLTAMPLLVLLYLKRYGSRSAIAPASGSH